MPEPGKASVSLSRGALTCRLSSDQVAPGQEVELRVGGIATATALAGGAAGNAVTAEFAVPQTALQDGATALDFHALPDGTHLARYTLFCGAELPADAASALALLQAEVQTLKRAFMAEAAVAKLAADERPLLVAEAVEQALAELDARWSGAARPRED